MQAEKTGTYLGSGFCLFIGVDPLIFQPLGLWMQ
jgi:hypothetical protein